MSERIRGSYDDALYKSTCTLLTFTTSVLEERCKDVKSAGDWNSNVEQQNTMARTGLHRTERLRGQYSVVVTSARL